MTIRKAVTHPVAKGDDRRRRIMETLQRQGQITVADIMERFACSEATARRDLVVLAETHAGIIRTIGGAHFEASPLREATFQEKKRLYWAEKERIAAQAAALVRDGDIVGLTGGTTTYLIARTLKASGIRATVVTNAVNVAMELADQEQLTVVLTGGVLRGSSFELHGPLAESATAQLNVGIMFVGVDGISAERGLTTYVEGEAQINRLLIGRASRVVAVFDHTKAETVSLFTIAPLAAVHACITDQRLSPGLESALRRQGTEIYYASESRE